MMIADTLKVPAPQSPTPELVIAARKIFDENYATEENAMRTVFDLFPRNDQLHGVLLKVMTLNSLYSTHILATRIAAQLIFNNSTEIDSALANGSSEIVEKIGKITINGKIRFCYSFATKYCSWHNQELYPIWDSRVDNYLWLLSKKYSFDDGLLRRRDSLWEYPKFLGIMKAFRSFYGLDEFSFKDIDKFMWLQGEAQGQQMSDAG